MKTAESPIAIAPPRSTQSTAWTTTKIDGTFRKMPITSAAAMDLGAAGRRAAVIASAPFSVDQPALRVAVRRCQIYWFATAQAITSVYQVHA